MTTGALVLLSTGSVAAADHRDAPAAGCERQFETAQRNDMESFRDFDADSFRASHDDDAVTVFAGGTVRVGIDSIMATLGSHFTNRNAVWTWREISRNVDGCRAAHILYETWYQIPAIGFQQRALTGVTYTHRGSGWVAIADQSTAVAWRAP